MPAIRTKVSRLVAEDRSGIDLLAIPRSRPLGGRKDDERENEPRPRGGRDHSDSK